MEKIELLTGQTPWQGMPREQLELEMEKAYFALIQTTAALRQVRGYALTSWNEGGNSYFGPNGIPAMAIANGDEVIAPYAERYVDPEFQAGYFRYTAPLLFKSEQRDRWAHCPTCSTSWKRSNSEDTAALIGTKCPSSKCEGTLEWFTWQHYGISRNAGNAT